MTRRSWAKQEIRDFLQLHGAGRTTREISGQLERTVPAVQGMLRKLKRLNDLHISPPDLVAFLAVSNAFVETHTLAQIRRRSAEDLTPVERFVRRSRWYRRPHLVGPYKRNRMGA